MNYSPVSHFSLITVKYFFYIILLLYTALLNAAPEKVSIQLKWQHSFQFAGYYAALEKGFYRDEGLDVSLKEIDFTKDFVEQVLRNESEYGVSDSTLLVYHLKGEPVVLVNQFFQHSPLVFLSHRESGIVSPYEMAGKRVAFNSNNQGDAALNALLLNTLADLSKIHTIPHSIPYYQNFINNKTDVVSAYSTSQPYLFKEMGIEVNIINPQNYGIDFYGDNFFTSLNELTQHPERVEKMSRATVKGWQYALDHTEEIIQLIRSKYAKSHSEAYLQYEARTTRQMIIPELIDLGSVDPKRYQQTAEDYLRLGFVDNSQIAKHFFYHQANPLQLTAQELDWLNKHPKIRVGGGPDWAPFDFVDNDGQYSGIANDYLKLIAEKTGLKFEISIDQWSNNLQKIANKQIDLLGAAYFTDERTEYVRFSKPYFEGLDYFFIRDDLKLKTLEDLNGKRVAIPKKFAHGEFLKKFFPKINIVTVATFGDAIDAVLENRADILYDNFAALTFVLKREGIGSIIPFKSTRELGVSPIHIITRKDEPNLASIIQKGLDAISSEEKQAIYQKWLGRKPQDEIMKFEFTVEEQQWIKANSPIRYGAEKNWPPYDFVNQKGEHKGLAKDYLQLISEMTGLVFEPVVDDWDILLEKAQTQQIDLLPVIYFSNERSEFLNFTQPYQTMLDYFFLRDDVKAETLADLNGKTVVIPRGFLHIETIKREFPQLKIKQVGSLTEAIQNVIEKKADILIESHSVISYLLKQHSITNIRAFKVLPPGKPRSLHMAAPKDQAILIGIINKSLDLISEFQNRSYIVNGLVMKRKIRKRALF